MFIRLQTWMILILAWFTLTNLAGGSENTPAQGAAAADAGHKRMLALLEKIERNTPDENPYLGDRKVRQLEALLENLSADTKVINKWKLGFETGLAKLYVGDVQAAIDYLTQAYRVVPEAQRKSLEASHTLYRLGVAYMRLGETQNCCARNTPDSCIIPIQGGGLQAEIGTFQVDIKSQIEQFLVGVQQRHATIVTGAADHDVQSPKLGVTFLEQPFDLIEVRDVDNPGRG